MFHLFTGSEYYPEGGVCDFKGTFYTVEAARKHAVDDIFEGEFHDIDWYQITDLSLKIIEAKGGLGRDETG